VIGDEFGRLNLCFGYFRQIRHGQSDAMCSSGMLPGNGLQK
jgi:hypothetical protein